MKIIKKLCGRLTTADVAAVIAVLIWTVIALVAINTRGIAEPLPKLLRAVHYICMAMALGYIPLRRWYKNATDRSLTADLLSPDYQGNLIQLVMRAKQYKPVPDCNLSPGAYTAQNSDGIVLGKDKQGNLIVSESSREEHVLVFGGSGTGKSSSGTMPTMERFKGTKFAIDIDGALTRVYSQKHNPIVIEPENISTAAFDPFCCVDEEKDKSKKMILLKQIAQIIVPESKPELRGDSVFYQTSAHLLFYSALIYYYESGLDLWQICFKIAEKSADDLIKEINAKGSANAKLALTGMKDIRAYITASIKQNLDQQISLFATNRFVREVLHRPSVNQLTISPAELETNDIILKISQEELSFFAPLIKLITEQIILYCTHRPVDRENKILLVLDEFATLGCMNILEPLRTLRKYGTRIMILTQSLSDLDLIYGEDSRRVICDNCRIKLVLGSGDAETNEYLSRLIGNKEVLSYSRTYSGTNTRHTYSSRIKPSVEPQQFSSLGDELVAVLPDGYMRLRKAYYWQTVD